MSKNKKSKSKIKSPVTKELAMVWRVITLTLFVVSLLSWLFGSGRAFAVLFPIVVSSVLGAVLYAAFENRSKGR